MRGPRTSSTNEPCTGHLQQDKLRRLDERTREDAMNTLKTIEAIREDHASALWDDLDELFQGMNQYNRGDHQHGKDGKSLAIS
jgi:hypothetical protein